MIGAKEQEKTFTVMGIIDANDFDKELGDTFTTFLIPEPTLAAMANGIHLTDKLVVQTDTEKEAQVGKELKSLIGQYPHLSLGTLEEQRQMAKSQFTILFSVMLGLSIFIIGFALINLLNTLITNILTRSHEFAMLQSVGMTKRQLCKMLRIQGLHTGGRQPCHISYIRYCGRICNDTDPSVFWGGLYAFCLPCLVFSGVCGIYTAGSDPGDRIHG